MTTVAGHLRKRGHFTIRCLECPVTVLAPNRDKALAIYVHHYRTRHEKD